MTTEFMAFERGVSPLLARILPDKARDVLAFRPAPELGARIEELAGKSNEGTLTADERAEYEGYVRANKFLAVLRREALRFSAQED